MIILPGVRRGGEPAQLAEGSFGAAQNPSTAFGGSPPHEIVGRMNG